MKDVFDKIVHIKKAESNVDVVEAEVKDQKKKEKKGKKKKKKKRSV